MSDADLEAMVTDEGDNRPNIYIEESGKVVYRASSLGDCFTSLVAYRLGMEPMSTPDWLQEKFDQGNENEPRILSMLEAEGWTLNGQAQEEIEIPVGTLAVIRSHIDETGYHPEHGTRIIEAKAITENTLKVWERHGWAKFERYAMQVSIYMAALQLPLYFVLGIKDAEGVAQRLIGIEVDEPPVKVGMFKARVIKVEKAAESGTLPDCDGKAMYPCPFFYMHPDKTESDDMARDLGVEKGTVKKVRSVIETQFNTAAEAYMKGAELESEGKRLKAGAKAMLMDEIEDSKVDALFSGVFEVKKVNGSNPRLNEKRMKEDGIDVDKYRESNWYTYPKVKRVGENNG